MILLPIAIILSVVISLLGIIIWCFTIHFKQTWLFIVGTIDLLWKSKLSFFTKTRSTLKLHFVPKRAGMKSQWVLNSVFQLHSPLWRACLSRLRQPTKLMERIVNWLWILMESRCWMYLEIWTPRTRNQSLFCSRSQRLCSLLPVDLPWTWTCLPTGTSMLLFLFVFFSFFC